jgi:hypothetical protein
MIIHGELKYFQHYEKLQAGAQTLSVNLRSDAFLEIGPRVQIYCYNCVLFGENGLHFEGEIINDLNTCYSNYDVASEGITAFH